MKLIEGYEQYSVTECGKVYSNRSNKFLKPSLGGGGRYMSVGFSINGKSKGFMVHRLVALTYIDNPESKKEVNHIDGDRMNNHASNLEWCTRSENMIHAVETGLLVPCKKSQFKKGFDSNRNDKSKLTEDDVISIRARHESGETFRSISDDYLVNESNIRRCCKRESYSNIM